MFPENETDAQGQLRAGKTSHQDLSNQGQKLSQKSGPVKGLVYPLPHKTFRQDFRSYTFRPMSRADAEYWIASYNAWRVSWEEHWRDEARAEMPVSFVLPGWPEACPVYCRRDSVLSFIPRTLLRCVGAIRLNGAYHHRAGAGFHYRPVRIEKIVWAAWMEGGKQ
jgi:hypothetical protein